MDIREMQRQQMREHFVGIAKTMVVEEGVDSVSVRKIADIAHCSYPTIYNYFRDMNELLWHVVASLLGDMYDSFRDFEEQNQYDTVDLKSLCRRYTEYFYHNPHLFTFFFFRDIGLPPPEIADMVSPPHIVHLTMGILEDCLGEAHSPEEIAAYCDLLTEALHGKLLFIFSHKEELVLPQILQSIDAMIDLIFNLS